MDVPKLIKTREYYDRTTGGEDKQSVALEIFGRKNPAAIEKSPEYLAIVSAASQVEKEKLKQEIEQVKRKQIKSYSTLLDKGEERDRRAYHQHSVCELLDDGLNILIIERY